MPQVYHMLLHLLQAEYYQVTQLMHNLHMDIQLILPIQLTEYLHKPTPNHNKLNPNNHKRINTNKDKNEHEYQ